MQPVKFGDVFEYQGTDYVFLAETTEIIYAAKILNREQTEKIQSQYNRLISSGRGSKSPVLDHVIYCFVILHTEEFSGRMAHFAKTGENDFQIAVNHICTLSFEDKKEIKEEILRKGSAVSLQLKELVRDIEV